MNQNPNSEQHMDVNVNAKQSMSAPVILQALALLTALGATYATMTGNDREHDTRIAQLRIDVTRLEGAQKDLKAEILTELRELRNELRERSKGGK